jgi:hypothetical protein
VRLWSRPVRDGRFLPCTLGRRVGAVLASILAAVAVVAVVVLAFLTDVLAAREQAQVRRLHDARPSRGAHERDRRRRQRF